MNTCYIRQRSVKWLRGKKVSFSTEKSLRHKDFQQMNKGTNLAM